MNKNVQYRLTFVQGTERAGATGAGVFSRAATRHSSLERAARKSPTTEETRCLRFKLFNWTL